MNDQAGYWKGYAKASGEESGGGGGLISHARVETGFKVFASGVGQDESWFPAQHTDKNARAVAKRAAKSLADDHGCKFAWGVAIITDKDKTFKGGEKCTWSVNTMVRFAPSYSSAHNEIVVPSLMEHKVYADGKPVWLRLGFKDDPYAVENDRKDSQGRTPQVAYVTEKFKNAVIAKKAIDQMPKGDGDNDDVPEMYREDLDVWEKVQAEIKAALENGDDPEEVAEDNGIDLRYVEAIQKTIIPM